MGRELPFFDQFSLWVMAWLLVFSKCNRWRWTMLCSIPPPNFPSKSDPSAICRIWSKTISTKRIIAYVLKMSCQSTLLDFFLSSARHITVPECLLVKGFPHSHWMFPFHYILWILELCGSCGAYQNEWLEKVINSKKKRGRNDIILFIAHNPTQTNFYTSFSFSQVINYHLTIMNKLLRPKSKNGIKKGHQNPNPP